jgi:hypothetical protein
VTLAAPPTLAAAPTPQVVPLSGGDHVGVHGPYPDLSASAVPDRALALALHANVASVVPPSSGPWTEVHAHHGPEPGLWWL